MYVRFPLSLRNVEDLLHERGIEVSHETVRFWWNRFGPMFAAEIRRKRVERMKAFSLWQWHLDEVFVKINGRQHYLWRAVDHEGEVLESLRDQDARPQGRTEIPQESAAATRLARGDGHGSLPLLRRGAEATRFSGSPGDGPVAEQPGENSHLPFRRRERAMQRFRRMRSLQKFASVHASVCNHFNSERSLYSRPNFKLNRAAALAEWRGLGAA